MSRFRGWWRSYRYRRQARAIWRRFEADPAFVQGMERGRAELAAGRGVLFEPSSTSLGAPLSSSRAAGGPVYPGRLYPVSQAEWEQASAAFTSRSRKARDDESGSAVRGAGR